MKTITNRNTTFWDVDDTLVMHALSTESIGIQDPIDPSHSVIVTPNNNMIRLMLEEKARGSFIIVWSRGGDAWAEAVIRALELQNTVDLVMTKPMAYFDDKPIEEWLPYRVYMRPDEEYKIGGKK